MTWVTMENKAKADNDYLGDSDIADNTSAELLTKRNLSFVTLDLRRVSGAGIKYCGLDVPSLESFFFNSVRKRNIASQ